MEDLTSVLESIGLTVTPDEGERITDALLITRTINMSTGDTELYVSHSDTDWLTLSGMYTVAGELLPGRVVEP